MDLVSCSSCGIVVDRDTYAMETEERYNHDQDKKGRAVRCPLCKEWIDPDIWEAVEEETYTRPSNERMEHFKRGGRD